MLHPLTIAKYRLLVALFDRPPQDVFQYIKTRIIVSGDHRFDCSLLWSMTHVLVGMFPEDVKITCIISKD